MKRRRHDLALALTAAAALAACSRSEQRSAGARAEPTSEASASAGHGPLVVAKGLRIVKASGDGDVASLVKAEREKALASGRELVVYVGATWCEPCQYFHHAAERGELDDDFPSLTVLEFDLDRDQERLTAADYTSKLIPLFVLPSADGRASERRFSGSVKGDRAVSNITPRLRALVAK